MLLCRVVPIEWVDAGKLTAECSNCARLGQLVTLTKRHNKGGFKLTI